MTSLLARGLSLLDAMFLRTAALLIPRPARSEWRQEWLAELWHVRRATMAGATMRWQAEVKVARFCGGAFQDAWCLRRATARQEIHGAAQPSLQGAASTCIVLLGASLVLAYGLSLVLPGVREKVDASQYQVPDGVILIQDAFIGNDQQPTISATSFRAWTSRSQSYFDAFAFYRVAYERLDSGVYNPRLLHVAHASPGLFTLLGVHVAADNTDSAIPSLILSTAAWKEDFKSNPDVVGTEVKLGNRSARVVAIMPESAWRLPGRADGWLLEPDSELAGTGYVVAHLNRRGRAEMLGNRIPITSSDEGDGADSLWGVSFAERMTRPRDMFLFTLFLALLALPAVTSVSMGEYSFNSHGSNWRRKLARWSFLLAKVALLVPAAYFASMDMAYFASTRYSEPAVYVQLVSSFVLCLFGLRWVMLDQRQRCPVCLCRVAHPAQVGQTGQTFLAWNGTEMICLGGHTLLHVPGLPTSWFSTQRWIYLDTSWQFLFVGTDAH